MFLSLAGSACLSAQSAVGSPSDQPQDCSSCHAEIVQQLNAHPHGTLAKPVSCSDCHTIGAEHPRDSHDTQVSPKKQVIVAGQNAACTRCHTSEAGPFTHEHPVVNAEGCGTCHAPHGSANPKMLTVASENALCLQCHAQTTTKPTHASARRPAAHPVDCTTCHHQIHGSDASEVFLQ